MSALARGFVVLATVLAVTPPALARCGPGDAAAVADARTAVETACGCATTRSHAIYVACANGTVKQRIAASLLPRRCGAAVERCAMRSTCGKRGVVTCCLTRKGRTRCKIMRSAARCLKKHGCVGVFPSCCDACDATGCRVPTTTTTTIRTTTTTTIHLASTTTITTSTTTTTTLVDGTQCQQFIEGTMNAPSESIPCGIALACHIEPAGETDAFTIDAPAGAVLAVNAAGPATTCWQAFDPDGMPIGAEHCDGLHELSIAKTGTQTIRVRFFSSSAIGDYTVAVDGVSAAFTCGVPLTLPTDMYSGQLSPGGDLDTFQFDAAANDAVSITVANPGHPCWTLFDPSGNIVKADRCDPAGTDSASGLAAGTYTILVRHLTDQATPYTLSLQRVTTP